MTESLAVDDMAGFGRSRGFDPDDIFGVRRALDTLPEHRWDDFFSTWGQLAETCELDPRRMQASAAREATTAAGSDPADAGLANAWQTVSDAMRSYLEWKTAPPAP
jgi:hypothetical protein